MKQVPFKFGEVVTGEHFTNREDEINKLRSNFISLQNTIIISPRRYGKSSLVKEAAERFVQKEKGYFFCFFDLMYIYSEEEFYNQFATKILKATSNKVEEFLQLAKNVLKGTRVTINTGTGEPALELGVNYIKDNIDTILNLPQIIAGKKKKKVIICIDEFQNISRFKQHEKLQGRLRSIWQHHKNVGYLLYGSKQTMMIEIFHKTNGPFYKFGETIYLNRIHKDRLREYVQQAFHSTGKEISGEICNRIIDTIENHPYYLQQFARNTWLISEEKVTEADFIEAKRSLISENLNFYNELLDNLTNYQVNFLRALLNKEEQLYSSEVIYSYKLGSSANIRRMYIAFVNKGIIIKEGGKIIFADPVFKLIAEQRFLPQ
ncbi:MAG: ATP-binding protein [Bacteroidales bacterium]|nr:ATP-binding protein [Bacteroidales bacterium]